MEGLSKYAACHNLRGLNEIPKLSHSQIYPRKSVVLLTSECFAFVSGPEGHISECLLSEH